MLNRAYSLGMGASPKSASGSTQRSGMDRGLNNRTYAVDQKSSFAAVLHLLFVFRFCARRAQKRNTDKTESTMLPFVLSLSKGRLRGVYARYCVSPVKYAPAQTSEVLAEIQDFRSLI